MVQLTDGDFERAVKESSKVLAIRGKVVPSTVSNVHLVAEYMDGTTTRGEAKIPNSNSHVKRVYLTDEDAYPTKDALEAIEEADVIILGPGSLYTSVIPNLIIKGLSEAVAKSQAFKVYICNVMTQQGETEGYSASDHIKALELMQGLKAAGHGPAVLQLLHQNRIPRTDRVQPRYRNRAHAHDTNLIVHVVTGHAVCRTRHNRDLMAAPGQVARKLLRVNPHAAQMVRRILLGKKTDPHGRLRQRIGHQINTVNSPAST